MFPYRKTLSKIFVLTALVGSFSMKATGQVLQWAKAYGSVSPGTVTNTSITVDASGNTFVTGQFGNTVDFDPGPGVLNITGVSAGFPDIFIAKYNSAGTFLWVKTMSGANSEGGNAITCDASGNIYITGFLSGPVYFDPGPGVQNITSTTVGTYDVFLAKYDNNGNYLWAFNIGSTGSDEGKGITADASGIIIAGDFNLTADFDPSGGTFNLTSAGLRDAFFAKYSFAGGLVWAKRIGGTGTDEAESICYDAVSNSYYLTGHFNAIADFDPGASTFNLTPSGGYDLYLAKYNSSGNFTWVFRIGGSSTEDVYSVASDPITGDAYITGSFSNTFDFDPSGSTFNLSGSAFGDIFLAKYSAGGNFIWAYKFGSNFAADVGRCVDVDPLGNVYVSGRFSNTIDFDPGAGTQNRTSSGSTDAFFAKYSSAGNYLFAGTFGNSSSSDQCISIISDGMNVYTSGSISGISDFDVSGSTFNAGTSGVFSAFVAKYGASPFPVELLSFNAFLNEQKKVNVVWVTASEKNNDYFTVERSGDNKTFKEIVSVNGAGTSSQMHSYKTIDNSPSEGINYYRVKQTDFDGQFTYSNTIAVNLSRNISVDVYPNPFTTTAILNIGGNSETECWKFQMYDTFGKEVLQKEFTSSFTEIKKENFSAGIYYYKVTSCDSEDNQGNILMGSGKVIAR